jgi:DNA-binding cell septation regulator SpoVG
MRSPGRISDVSFMPAAPELRRTGLLGYATCLLDGWLHLDGLSVRRSEEGRLYVALPRRRDAAGNEHPYYRPTTPALKRAIETQVLAAVMRGGYVA